MGYIGSNPIKTPKETVMPFETNGYFYPRYAKGTVVRLKAGGPKMVVETAASSPTVEDRIRRKTTAAVCIWFEGNVLFREKFDEDTLESA